MKKLYLLLIALAACANPEANESDPQELVVGFVPSEESARMVKNLQPITDFLAQELAMPVTVYQGSDYTAIIEGMRGEKVDVGIFGSFSYVLASQQAGAEPLVVPSKRTGEPATYRSLLITHTNSGIDNLEQLKSQPGTFSLSFSDPVSTSGHLVPRGQLQSLGMVPEGHFRDIMFSGSHPATILALATGKVDVAGCSYTVFGKMLERGMIKANQVRILWQSEPLPVDLVTVREGLSDSLKTQLLDIYLRLSDEVPGTAQYFYQEWDDSTLVFLPAHDSLYREIRRLSGQVTDTF
ncbi:MAG: phosphate/phosphite/phosphonate ABC transporter substrate-binding protein [Bacteroidota bacterium]